MPAKADPTLAHRRRLGLGIASASLLTLLGLAAFADPPRDPVRVTHSEVAERAPDWSPDGQWLVFVAEGDLQRIRPDGTERERLTQTPAEVGYPTWSPSGDRILYQAELEGRTDLWTLRLDDHEVRRLTDDARREVFPSWSPDGHSIVYSVAPETEGAEWRIERLVLESGERVELLTEPVPSLWPRFDPAGATLAFFSRRDTDGDNDEIYRLDLASGGLERLTDRAGHDFCPAWSPDGERLAVATVEGERRFLAILAGDGTPIERFDHGFERATEPSWSPDGSSIAFTARLDGNYDIWIQPIRED